MTITTKRIGAKIVLYGDGTAAVSVFLIEAVPAAILRA